MSWSQPCPSPAPAHSSSPRPARWCGPHCGGPCCSAASLLGSECLSCTLSTDASVLAGLCVIPSISATVFAPLSTGLLPLCWALSVVRSPGCFCVSLCSTLGLKVSRSHALHTHSTPLVAGQLDEDHRLMVQRLSFNTRLEAYISRLHLAALHPTMRQKINSKVIFPSVGCAAPRTTRFVLAPGPADVRCTEKRDDLGSFSE